MCLIFSPRRARLVSCDSGSPFVAPLTRESASSFPVMFVWPGTQWSDTVAPFSTTMCAASMALI